MIQFFMKFLILMLSFTFMQMNHPLSMGMIILIQTILISLLTGLMMKNFWFSYILFLIFLGGMLILFIYITALASNEMFSLSINLVYMLPIPLLMIFITLNKNMIINLFNQNNEMTPLNMINFLQENSINLIKLYNYPTNMINIMMMNYLLITLIAVVKITNSHYGPLRPMFN